MKRVLHLRSSGGVLGAEKVIHEITKNSPKYDYESIIGVIHDNKDSYPEFMDYLRDYGIKIVVFEGNGKTDKKRVKDIDKFIIKNKIDIVHSHGYKEDYHCIKLKSKIPKIATNHLWKRSNLKSRVYTCLDAIFLHLFNIVTGVSSEIIEDMRRYGLKRAVKVTNGIDFNLYGVLEKNNELKKKMRIPNDSVVIGMVSSITKVKGHITAIKAFEMLKEKHKTYLLIVGEGNMSIKIKEKVEGNELTDKIKFAGKTNNVTDYLSIIDIFLITSYREGLPISLLEAMASGKSVISTRVGEIPEIIRDGNNGFLINSGDQSELACKIKMLIDDKEKRKITGIAARNSILNKYSSKKMTKNYCRLYNVLLKNKD